jgi:hypothetical protein
LITFDEWDKGGIFDWYRAYRKRHSTLVQKLELRKERDNFKHEFVAVYLDTGRIHRIDRRPIVGANIDAISSKGCEAEDSITRVKGDELVTMQSDTDLEIELEFKSNQPDLYTVLAICVCIRMDTRSARYSLQHYNCYFVARTIIVLMMRHHMLQRPAAFGGSLRWDALTEPAVSKHIFRDHWNYLDVAMKNALITTLGTVLWPIIKGDVGLAVRKKKQWAELETITKTVIREAMMKKRDDLVTASVKGSVTSWATQATQTNLWHDSLEKGLSAPLFRLSYETAARQVLASAMKHDLSMSLPDDITTQLSHVLQEHLISRLPPSLIASLPPEIVARFPPRVLETLPDEVVRRTSTDFMPGVMSEMYPSSWYHTRSSEALGHVPPCHGSKFRVSFLAKMPPERIPSHHLLKTVPPASLEKLPDNFLERVPAQHLRTVAEQLLENLPENLLRRAIDDKIFDSEELRAELAGNARYILTEAVRCAPGVLRNSGVRVRVYNQSKMKDRQIDVLKTHEDFQQVVLNMIRKHSKTIAQVSNFGLHEDAVYDELRCKIEDIWRTMRLHELSPDRPGCSRYSMGPCRLFLRRD